MKVECKGKTRKTTRATGAITTEEIATTTINAKEAKATTTTVIVANMVAMASLADRTLATRAMVIGEATVVSPKEVITTGVMGIETTKTAAITMDDVIINGRVVSTRDSTRNRLILSLTTDFTTRMTPTSLAR